MKQILILILYLVILASLSQLAKAEDTGKGVDPEKFFAQWDKNGDGKLTLEETGSEKLHKRMDLNADGFVTLEEAIKALTKIRAVENAPTAPPATILEGKNINEPPTPAPNEPPVSENPAFTSLAFSRDYHAGAKDANDRLMGGTETLFLVPHNGMLFASTGVWMDIPYYRPPQQGLPDWTGPQVLVKESACTPWRVEASFPNDRRAEGMVSAVFEKDAEGKKLEPPVSLLVVSPSSDESLATWVRDDPTGKWTKSTVSEAARGGIRAFCMHTDKVTGLQYLFGGSSWVPGVFKAVYSPTSPGRLRWDSYPELSGTGRIMCMAVANGTLYAAAGIADENPLSGGLFRRIDGEKPRWELVWRWPHKIAENSDESEIMRGLTAISDPAGGGHQVLLGTCNYPGVVYRIDPMKNFSATTELDFRAYFARAFKVAELRGPCLSAYNNFLPVTDPDSGEKVHLLGIWVIYPDTKPTELRSSAWYMVRHADGTYAHGRVFDPHFPMPNKQRGLLATRTIQISPFPEDKGRVFYFGGFDCAKIESHNTAWIYKGQLK